MSLQLERPAATPRPSSLRSMLCLMLGLSTVIAIVLYPNFVRGGCGGQLTACKSNLKNMGTALEMYATDWDGKYPRSLSQLTPNYLKTVPQCPTAAYSSYRATFGPKAPLNPDGFRDYYLVECTGSNHQNVCVEGDYPAYNGIQGLIERAP